MGNGATSLFVGLVSAFGVSLLMARGLVSSSARSLVLDVPNERSLHARPVPRSGGLAIAMGVIAGWGALGVGEFAALGGIALGLVVISLLDDLRGLPIVVRLLAQICASVGLLWVSDPVSTWFLTGVIALGIVWAINLFNFMDGSDGLAGGMAASGFGFYALAAILGGETALAGASAAIAAAAAAFLVYNFHPARLFMGDSGAVPLGFLAAGLGFLGWQHGVWSAWFPLLVFSPFVADASVTLIRRLLRGERIWRAHREHYYQRLVLLGLGHRGTALLEYGLMLGAGVLAMVTQWRPDLAQIVVLAWCGTLAMAMVLTDRHWSARKNKD